MFLPLMTSFCVILLILDSENILTFLEGVALFPFLVIAASSDTVTRSLGRST